MTTILLLGFTVGIILALTGAGGGILAVPLLVFGAGLSMAEAGPIGLLAVGLAALLISVTGILFSPLGLWLAQRMPNRPLTIVFAFVLLFVAWRVFQKSMPSTGQDQTAQRIPPCQIDSSKGKLIWTAPCARALALAGVAAGGLSGLLGVGGGFVMVPALQRYTNLATQSILATSLAVIALVSMSGVVASTLSGHLQWTIALPFSGGALAGMIAGRLVAARLSGSLLQKGFAIVSALVAVALLIKALR